MAKRGILEHPKTMDLAVTLGVDECLAVGVLECFWHHIARYFPDGDVTTVRPALLARSIRYSGDAVVLWEALQSAGFLRRHGERLVVHDWSEHADDAVHLALARRRQYFADGTEPRLSRLGGAEKVEITAFYRGTRAPEASEERTETPAERPEAGDETPAERMEGGDETPAERTEGVDEAHAGRTLSAPPEPWPEPWPEPMPEPESVRTSPDGAARPPRRAPRRAPPNTAQLWSEFTELYPAREGSLNRAKAKEMFRTLLIGGTPGQEILDGTRRYREFMNAQPAGKGTGSQFVQMMTTFLNRCQWREQWTRQPPAGGGGAAGRKVAALLEGRPDGY